MTNTIRSAAPNAASYTMQQKFTLGYAGYLAHHLEQLILRTDDKSYKLHDVYAKALAEEGLAFDPTIGPLLQRHATQQDRREATQRMHRLLATRPEINAAIRLHAASRTLLQSGKCARLLPHCTATVTRNDLGILKDIHVPKASVAQTLRYVTSPSQKSTVQSERAFDGMKFLRENMRFHRDHHTHEALARFAGNHDDVIVLQRVALQPAILVPAQ